MILLSFETNREVITRWIIQFFEYLGINPFVGIALLGTIVLLLRVRTYLKKRKAKEKYGGYEVFEDIVLAIATIGIFLVILYQD